MKIIFDSEPPVKTEVVVHTPEVEPEKNVVFELSPFPPQDNEGGFGLPKFSEGLITVTLKGNPVTFGHIKPERRRLAFKAPKEADTYAFSVVVKDLLGNETKPVKKTFRVREKPKPVVKKEKKEDPKPVEPPPEPPKHTLIIKVRVASSALEADQEPELKIEPPDGAPKRVGADSFEIKGLKGGVNYTISGKYRTTGAFKVETEGSVSHEFDAKSKTKITKTKILKLTGK